MKRAKNYLLEHLSEEQLISLCEAFGGTRLYIPTKAEDDHEIVAAVGREVFEILTNVFSPDYIRVPLCRDIRAKHYKASGLSVRKIATRLCMTEPGVNKMLSRMGLIGDTRPVPTSVTSEALTPESNARAGINIRALMVQSRDQASRP